MTEQRPEQTPMTAGAGFFPGMAAGLARAAAANEKAKCAECVRLQRTIDNLEKKVAHYISESEGYIDTIAGLQRELDDGPRMATIEGTKSETIRKLQARDECQRRDLDKTYLMLMMLLGHVPMKWSYGDAVPEEQES